MTKTRRSPLLNFFLAAFFLIGMTACSKTTQSTSQSETPKGNPSLQFDYKKATELLISKSDPNTGDRWTARILRDLQGGAPSSENENLWTIEMGPDGMTYGDRKAYGFFILHLLDTARTLQLKEALVSGSPESFGLLSPLFTLRWKVAGSSELELRLGQPAKNPDGSLNGLYASLESSRPRSTGGENSKVFVAQGAMLQMLDMLSTFSVLRLSSLTTFTSDDVDELEIDSRSAHPFYAQREGDQWTNRKHTALKADVSGFLEEITHLRVLKFIDLPQELKTIATTLEKHPLHVLIFKDRNGTPTSLRLSKSGEKVYASVSNRKRKTESGSEALSVFEVYPKILQELAELGGF